MLKWQDISTAPRDGTKVDLWIAHTGWRKEYDGRTANCEFFKGRWVDWNDDNIDCPLEQLEPLKDGGTWQATHWMPLPEPPQ